MMKSIRRLRRFFCVSPLPDEGRSVVLSEEETRHLRSILRLKPGDRCLITDGRGVEASAVIENFLDSGESVLSIEHRRTGEVRGRRLVLNAYVAVPRRGKIDFLVEKCQEWQVDSLQPLETERCEVKMPEPQKDKALGRWNKITREAAKQSGSLRLVRVSKPAGLFPSLDSIAPGGGVIFFHPCAEAEAFHDWVEGLKKDCRENPLGDLHLFFGPEGGFSENEIRRALEKKVRLVSLGESILKVDTAFCGVISTLRLLFP
jgi:16S rRNA (uracil1498-N3)-methyltransferase